MKLCFIRYQMVGRSDDDIGVSATTLDVISGVGDARRSISSCRLTKHLVGTQHRQVFQDEMLVGLIGHHEEVLVGDDGTETLVSTADKAFSCAKDIEELLGIVVFAERPKAATDATGHDDAVVVH